MVKEEAVRLGVHAVPPHLEKGDRTAEVCELVEIDGRTLRNRRGSYREGGREGAFGASPDAPTTARIEPKATSSIASSDRGEGTSVRRATDSRHPWVGEGARMNRVPIRRVRKRHGCVLPRVSKPTPLERAQPHHVDSLSRVDGRKHAANGLYYRKAARSGTPRDPWVKPIWDGVGFATEINALRIRLYREPARGRGVQRSRAPAGRDARPPRYRARCIP